MNPTSKILRKSWILMMAGIFLMYSCSRINSEHAYYRWLNAEKHHLFVTKTINGVSLSVKFLPPEYLAYKELNGRHPSKNVIDSTVNIYHHCITFLLTMKMENRDPETKTGDLMYKDITSPEQYDDRLQDLSFKMSEYVKLETELNTYTPVLHTFENTYGISAARSIYLVFALKDNNNDDLFTSENLDIVFDDHVFMTGISHFRFRRKDLDNIPQLNFWEK